MGKFEILKNEKRSYSQDEIVKIGALADKYSQDSKLRYFLNIKLNLSQKLDLSEKRDSPRNLDFVTKIEICLKNCNFVSDIICCQENLISEIGFCLKNQIPSQKLVVSSAQTDTDCLKIQFCLKSWILSQKLDFFSKFGFCLKIWILSQNLDFVSKFGFCLENGIFSKTIR